MLTRRPLRVAVLCSRRAPGLVHLLARAPRRGFTWDVVCCATSEETFDEQVRVERRGVPVLAHPVRRFYFERRQDPHIADLTLREEYDARTVALVAPYRPDLVLLTGYRLLLTAPMLDAFRDRIFNVHHADLLRRNPAGAALYPGLRAVRDAILAGERETRSTVHRVTADVDRGRPLLRSWPFAVPDVASWSRRASAGDVLRSVIWAHQEWMLRCASGPLLSCTLDLAAEDDLAFDVRELDVDGSLRSTALA